MAEARSLAVDDAPAGHPQAGIEAQDADRAGRPQVERRPVPSDAPGPDVAEGAVARRRQFRPGAFSIPNVRD
jgi:hypothetical protein